MRHTFSLFNHYSLPKLKMMYTCSEKSRAVCLTYQMSQSVSTHSVVFDVNTLYVYVCVFDVIRLVIKDKNHMNKSYLIYNACSCFVHNITLMVMLYINYILHIWIVSQIIPRAMYRWHQGSLNRSHFPWRLYGKWLKSFLSTNKSKRHNISS